MHSLGVDDRRDREDDYGGEHPLDRAGEDLRDSDEPDWAGGLHAVLDLARVAELRRELQRDGLDALEHDRDRDNAGHEHGREGGLAGPSRAAADTLPDRREDVQED